MSITPDWFSIPITTLIPQRPPFVFVDGVSSFSDDNTVTEFVVRPDNIFLDDGRLAAAGIIENMAQSCAARMGCLNILRHEDVQIGFIGDIRDCRILRQPLLGDTVHTTVHILEEVFNLTLAEVSSRIGDEVIASARVKIALVGQASKE
ncbi:MAG: pseudouridylate synthase [Prevotella sp.]|nr:pseudouridylate synthase [Prevotella sp.]